MTKIKRINNKSTALLPQSARCFAEMPRCRPSTAIAQPAGVFYLGPRLKDEKAPFPQSIEDDEHLWQKVYTRRLFRNVTGNATAPTMRWRRQCAPRAPVYAGPGNCWFWVEQRFSAAFSCPALIWALAPEGPAAPL